MTLQAPAWMRGGRRSLLRKMVDHKPRKDWDRISKNMYVRFDGALIVKNGDDWVAKTPRECLRHGCRSMCGRSYILQHGQKPAVRQKFKSHRKARKQLDEFYPPVREKF